MTAGDPPDVVFHPQEAAAAEGATASAFFACRHFLGALALVAFHDKAERAAGLLETIAAVLAHAGREYDSPPSPNLLPDVRRILVAHSAEGRFVTLRRADDGAWWDYDSAAEEMMPVADIDAYLRHPRGDRFWYGS